MLGFFKKKKDNEHVLGAPAKGKAVPMKAVNDPTFNSGILGEGVAVIPSEGKIYAPEDGTVGMLFETLHAVSLTTEYGAEILIHVGIDTVDMNGDGFELFVKEGDRVKTGDPLISFTPEKIKAAGHPMTTAFLITDNGSASDVRFISNQDAKAGQTVIAEYA